MSIRTRVMLWALAALMAVGVTALVIRRDQARGFDDFEVSTMAGVTVTALTPSGNMPRGRIDEFDISPDGAVIVRVDDMLYDLASGECLGGEEGVQSFAFVSGALAILSNDGQLGYWTHEGFCRVSGNFRCAHGELRGADDGSHLLIYGGDGAPYHLFSLAARSNPLLLTDYSEATCAVAAEGGRDLLAVGRSLFEIRESGKPLLLMTLPERFGAILGIAVARDTLYFSTSKGVYAMNGNLVVPVVLGLGGPLHVTSDSLIVLDANRSHLYRIAWGSE